MKKGSRLIGLVAVVAAIVAPAAQAGSTWSSVRPADVVRQHPRDVVRDVVRHHPGDATRRVRWTGFSDGRLAPLGLPWGG